LFGRRPTTTWAPVQRMIQAAQNSMRLEGKKLRDLLERSNQRLAPLADPLFVDFAAHRWLQHQREEAYSDWLAWILEQLSTPEQIHRVFGLASARQSRFDSPVIVGREIKVDEGHEGHSGRIDLVVKSGEHTVLVIEVKKTEADTAVTTKGAGYSRSLPAGIPRVLLALSGELEVYEGEFKLVTWGQVFLALRGMVRELCQENTVIQAAMILAFVGAVEENLLGFPTKKIHRLMKGDPVQVSSAIGKHLERWLSIEGRHEPA
jgi:hypothetical protein